MYIDSLLNLINHISMCICMYCDTAHSPVSEGCDDQSRSVPKILIRVLELCITNVGKTVLLLFIPPISTFYTIRIEN